VIKPVIGIEMKKLSSHFLPHGTLPDLYGVAFFSIIMN